MFARILFLTAALLLAAAEACAQPVTVIGPVTPGNVPVFNSPTVIKDSGLQPGGGGGGCIIAGGFPIGTGSTTQCSTTPGSAAILSGKLTITGPNNGAPDLIALQGAVGIGTSTPGSMNPPISGQPNGSCFIYCLDVQYPAGGQGFGASLNLNGEQGTYYALGTDAGYAWFANIAPAIGPAYAWTLSSSNQTGALYLVYSNNSFSQTPFISTGPMALSQYWTYFTVNVNGIPPGGYFTGGNYSCAVAGSANACFTATIAGTTMTVSSVASGVIRPGAKVLGTSVALPTFVVSQLTGSAGSTGTYRVSYSQTIASPTSMIGVVVPFFNAALAVAWNYYNNGEVDLVGDTSGRGANAVTFSFNDWNEQTNVLTRLVEFNSMTNTQPGALVPFFGIGGVTTISNACAGCVGEYIFSDLSPNSSVILNNDVWTQVTAITLTAGDWDVSANIGVCYNDNAGNKCTGARINGNINFAAGSFDTSVGQPVSVAQFTEFLGAGWFTGINLPTLPLGPQRFNVNTPTTIRLNGYCEQAGVSGGATTICAMYGKIQARRRR